MPRPRDRLTDAGYGLGWSVVCRLPNRGPSGDSGLQPTLPGVARAPGCRYSREPAPGDREPGARGLAHWILTDPFSGLLTLLSTEVRAKGSSATQRAWLAVFKCVRNSLSGSVATWASSGRAHHVTQDHPVYIPGDLNCSASRRQRPCRAGRPGGLCEIGETGSQPGTPDRPASQPVRRCYCMSR